MQARKKTLVPSDFMCRGGMLKMQRRTAESAGRDRHKVIDDRLD